MTPADGSKWELRVADRWLQLAPLGLALFCLVLSQANDVVFWGFGEDEPGTRLSTVLMAACLVVAAAGARRADRPRQIRVAGGILAAISGIAVLDENLGWHEWIGRQVQRDVTVLPRSVTWYTDDVIVLLGAIVGGFLVYRLMRYVATAYDSRREMIELLPYLGCTVAFAVAHGLLDIGGHSHYMVDRIWPELSRAAANDYVERISYFEEVCKLWTEWFALLLLLRLLHGRRGPLAWSLAAATGSGIVLLGGLWGVDDVARGIPALTLGDPLAFLRNFHGLFALCWIWVAWAVIGLVCFRRDGPRWELSGVLLVLPVAPILGRLIDADRLGWAIQVTATWLLPEAWYGSSAIRHGWLLVLLLLPGLVAGYVAGQAIRRWPLRVGLTIGVAAAIAPWGTPHAGTIALVAVTGGCVVVGVLRSDRFRAAWLMSGVLLVAAAAASPWWLVLALTWATFVWALEAPERQQKRRSALLLTLAAVQTIVAIALVPATSVRFTPNYEWEPDPRPAFRVIDQPFENPAPD